MDTATAKSLIRKITCTTCKYFTWELACMKPKHDARGAVHHPSCPKLRV